MRDHSDDKDAPVMPTDPGERQSQRESSGGSLSLDSHSALASNHSFTLATLPMHPKETDGFIVVESTPSTSADSDLNAPPNENRSMLTASNIEQLNVHHDGCPFPERLWKAPITSSLKTAPPQAVPGQLPLDDTPLGEPFGPVLAEPADESVYGVGAWAVTEHRFQGPLVEE